MATSTCVSGIVVSPTSQVVSFIGFSPSRVGNEACFFTCTQAHARAHVDQQTDEKNDAENGSKSGNERGGGERSRANLAA